MYKLLLIFKYLARKAAPLFAAVAVALCTAMVIIVMSVMGGFLDLISTSVRQLTGDVTITSYSYTGFSHYEELVTMLEAEPEISVATPVMQSYGLLQLGNRQYTVEVRGIYPEQFAEVVRYREALHWSEEDIADYHPGFKPREWGMDLASEPLNSPTTNQPLSMLVTGIEISPTNQRDEHGHYSPGGSTVGRLAMLTVVPVNRSGALLEPAVRQFAVVNDFKSGMYDADANVVFIHFDRLQRMMELEERQRVDLETGEPTGDVVRARASEVMLKAAPGFTEHDALAAADKVVARLAEQEPGAPILFPMTWDQRHARLLGAVKSEKGLVTFLFAIVSGVAVLMVTITLYMIVLGKSRDIGVLRAIGASRPGIAGLFVGYGFAIGVLGGGVGLLIAVAVVKKLNVIQFWLAHYLGMTSVVVGAALLGGIAAAVVLAVTGIFRGWIGSAVWRLAAIMTLIPPLIASIVLLVMKSWCIALNEVIYLKIWDPQTYVFDRIPDRIDPWEAGFIVLGAIVSSVVGGLIPAIRAAMQDPIEALRNE